MTNNSDAVRKRYGKSGLLQRITKFLQDRGVDPRRAVQEAPRQDARDQQIKGDHSGDDCCDPVEGSHVDEDAEHERHDNPNNPVFRSDIPGHAPKPLCLC